MDSIIIQCLPVAIILVFFSLALAGMEANRRGWRLVRVERKLDALLKKLEVDPDAGVQAEVLALARAGNKIEAIKKYREVSGVGLKEAKEYVESLR